MLKYVVRHRVKNADKFGNKRSYFGVKGHGFKWNPLILLKSKPNNTEHAVTNYNIKDTLIIEDNEFTNELKDHKIVYIDSDEGEEDNDQDKETDRLVCRRSTTSIQSQS